MARKGSSLSLVNTRWLAKSPKSPIHEALDILDPSSLVCPLSVCFEPFVIELGVPAKEIAKSPRDMKDNIPPDD
jgi:hypothetical protein